MRKNPRGIYATCDGYIFTAGYSETLGNRIYKRIDGYQSIERYCHLSEIFVKDSQFVREGDLIGIMGNTGNSTGTHLHYDILRDDTELSSKNTIDPTEHLKSHTPPTNTKVTGQYNEDYSHIYHRPYRHKGVDFGTELIPGWDCRFIDEFRENIKRV